ncbi:MAG: hypothetical protein ACXW6J_11260 [Candidatus Binatia bacterium]
MQEKSLSALVMDDKKAGNFSLMRIGTSVLIEHDVSSDNDFV